MRSLREISHCTNLEGIHQRELTGDVKLRKERSKEWRDADSFKKNPDAKMQCTQDAVLLLQFWTIHGLTAHSQIVFLCTLNWTDFWTWGQVMRLQLHHYKGQVNMYCMKHFSSPLSRSPPQILCLHVSLPFSCSLFTASLRQPAHHSARTPQQPYAIREEPTAAIFINIDSDPSGSVLATHSSRENTRRSSRSAGCGGLLWKIFN